MRIPKEQCVAGAVAISIRERRKNDHSSQFRIKGNHEVIVRDEAKEEENEILVLVD